MWATPHSQVFTKTDYGKSKLKLIPVEGEGVQVAKMMPMQK
jgi:hypothetical protein